ncbi:glucose-6-phosphate isomerase [Prochlorococcus marinus]|uniref:Glucose-6-phosphate isomerase n=1 Tax=Prochlorococcus marinus (strain MIT 9211) TaxID=93059 RepID=G6PI_PROM4|nr:glucose-6-phosphate isomerase [Prochlorococcus marinus]A9BAE3.1 RecName: Full=Glucose-6-phosphate isomerase; Short=GPI; AltName: Full=Phosphoglucose isomerase; Short=PGI; AltName: Full=Phosphohexose isomerase; Short=PHI [Prochlorococcus marinus str. MIT 9211]ABX08805.1 Phosphoglucose isomerase (PGI) [Prochlorococcus marinus str. MIT 9211]
MNLPDYSPNNSSLQWERFSELLWHNEELGLWVDISRMNVNEHELKELKPIFQKAFEAMNSLEKGSMANIDEERMVGHYWLRNPDLAPSRDISKLIANQISQIEQFTTSILSGDIRSDAGELFTDVLWIGIGGSGLGPLLLIESLQELNKGLKFHFLDNVDPIGIDKKLELLQSKLSTTLFVVVSKSGGTPEPQIAMDQARHVVETNGKNWPTRSVAITMCNSLLDNKAKQENWLKTFDLPDWVGGRTSITGAVGLLPLGLIDSDLKSFLLGASKMDELTRNNELLDNPAALMAMAWYSSGSAKGLKDMVVLPYRDSLEVFSRYLQQLVMESLGKKNDREGNIVFQGLSVYGNKGSTDQHAYVQQLRDGINNFFVTFIEVLTNNESPCLNNKLPGDYLSGFMQGTRLALSDSNRQSLTITLKTFDPLSLGALIALFERTVGLYAELININAYHQPGVEAGKKAAADILNLQLQIEDILSDYSNYSIEQISTRLSSSNSESIYFILRNLVFNNKYSAKGSWKNPSSLIFKREKL